nr:hypothetical protein [Tanacetum cinerariifolium]
LLSDNSIPLTEDKSSDSDHQDDLSVPRPPLEPPNAEFDFEPDTGDEILVVMNAIDELECLKPRDKFDYDDYYSFMVLIYSKDGDSQREEIDIVTETDDVLPPTDLSEMELKKILIEKMEGNRSIQRSDEQRNLYKALVESYEAAKTILDTYGESTILKRRREDGDQEGPSAG